MRLRITTVLLIIAFAVVLSACGGGHGKAVRTEAIITPTPINSGGDNLPDNGGNSGGEGAENGNGGSGPLPGVLELDDVIAAPRQASLELRLVSLGTDALNDGLTGTNGASPDNITSSGTELSLRAFAKGEYSYAIYAQSIGAAVKPQSTQVSCHASTTGATDETPLPLSYYMGFADYTVNTWRWFGPFSEDTAQAEVNTDTLQSSFISPGSFFYICVLAVPDSKAASALPEDGIVSALPFIADGHVASQVAFAPGGVTIQEVDTWTADGVATIPAMVTGLKAEDYFDELHLTWDASSDNSVDAYEVFWDDLDDTAPAELLYSLDAAYTEYFAGGTAGNQYRFSVRAHNPTGYSEFAFADALMPVYVGGLYATNNSESQIYIGWNGNSSILSYELYRADSSDATPALLATLTPPTYQYHDTEAPVDKEQYYWIKAYGGNIDSGMVGPVSGIRFLDPLIWSRTWGLTPTNYNIGNCIAVDDNGSVFTAGYMDSMGTQGYDSVLLKYNPTGTIQWVKAWGGAGTEIAHGIALDADGNVYLAGQTASYGAGGSDIFILKYDTDGNLLWKKTWGGTMNDIGNGIALDADGFVYVTGETRSFGAGNGDAVLLKYDADSSFVWAKTWGGPEEESGNAIALQNGNLYVGGETSSFGSGGLDMALLKLDTDGNLVWEKAWGGTGDEACHGLAVDADENVVITGNDPYMMAADIYTVKYDSAGELVFQTANAGGYQACGICLDASGNSYIIGYSVSSLLIFKHSPDGVLLSQKQYSGSLLDLGGGITTSPGGGIFACGFQYTSGYSSFSLLPGVEAAPDAYEVTTVGTMTVIVGSESSPADGGYYPIDYSQGTRGMLTMSLDPAKI
jgi:uncharacterized delta-60 repeat protein